MKKHITVAAVAACVLISGSFQAQAQFGGFGNKLIGGKLTVESLNTDLFGGLDFFTKATVFYAQALLPVEESKKIEAELASSNDRVKQEKAVVVVADRIKSNAEERKAKGEKLSQDAQDLVKKGNGEYAKGVTKWAALAGSIALAAKQGGQDAALATAIPVAIEMIKDLPALKKMNEAISALNKLK